MPPINRYDIGSSVTVTGTYTNTGTGQVVDPDDARVDIVSPTGTKTTYMYSSPSTLVRRVSVGVYQFDVDTTGLAGRWQYRWWSPPGTSVQVASANEFIVNPFPATTP